MLASTSWAATRPVDAAIDDALRDLVPMARSGVLIDRVLPLARIEELDGDPNSPSADARRWRQAYDELRRATIGTPTGPDLATLDAGARASARAGVLPIALFDLAYDRVRPDAMTDGSLKLAQGRIERTAASPLIESRAVAAAVLAPATYQGGALVFSLERGRFVSDAGDAGDAPRAIAIDFDDGSGFRPAAFGEHLRVRYGATGTRTLQARVTRGDGSEAVARFSFEVRGLVAPTPDDTLRITATTPHLGRFGTGDAYVLLAPGHTSLVNPVVVIEGFDLDNNMDWDALHAMLNQQNLIETLRADGFDAVVRTSTTPPPRSRRTRTSWPNWCSRSRR